MTRRDPAEARYLLRKLKTQEAADVVLSHPWVRESDRWRELAFALLTSIGRGSEPEIRALTERLSVRQLLEIPELAALRQGRATVDLNAPAARGILEVLQEGGFSQHAARQALTTLCEAAAGLAEHHDGKIQRYLRGWGERMLQERDRTFKFSALSDSDAADAFTYWLQNVLAMPLSLIDDNVKSVCQQHGVEPNDLIAAADADDLNLGVVDDLAQRYRVERKTKKAAAPTAHVEHARAKEAHHGRGRALAAR